MEATIMIYQEQLYAKFKREYNSFMNKLRELTPDQIVEHAYEKVCKEDILRVFENRELLSDAQTRMLLARDCGLNDFYDAWLDRDADTLDLIRESVENHLDTLETQSWRKYKAEINNPHEPEFPEFQVFDARDDADAVKQAHEISEEWEGEDTYLLELHELDDSYNIIREVNLRTHDPDIRRFMNVDLIDFMGQVAERVIVHHPKDFLVDTEQLWKAATDGNRDKNLM
jgi:hypothetical protein